MSPGSIRNCEAYRVKRSRLDTTYAEFKRFDYRLANQHTDIPIDRVEANLLVFR
ncbi:MAG: hypothetical protein JO275_06065 [Verrucomicrobia bacterium]|nr:hypothetical protein [Verrucomicrobiota bacterium]